MRRDMVIEKVGSRADGVRGMAEQEVWANGYRYDVSSMESLCIPKLTLLSQLPIQQRSLSDNRHLSLVMVRVLESGQVTWLDAGAMDRITSERP